MAIGKIQNIYLFGASVIRRRLRVRAMKAIKFRRAIESRRMRGGRFRTLIGLGALTMAAFVGVQPVLASAVAKPTLVSPQWIWGYYQTLPACEADGAEGIALSQWTSYVC